MCWHPAQESCRASGALSNATTPGCPQTAGAGQLLTAFGAAFATFELLFLVQVLP